MQMQPTQNSARLICDVGLQDREGVAAPTLGGKCIRCYRCLTGCSNNAYSARWWLGNLVCPVLWNETLMRWFGDYD
jgi:ferredoxin